MKKLIIIVCTVAVLSRGYGLGIEWTNQYNDTNIVVEVWSSTNLVNWNLKTNIPSATTNYMIIKPLNQEFFKIRNKNLSNGYVSIWSN